MIKGQAYIDDLDWTPPMPHLWLRAETRDNETRTPLTPDGVKALITAGFRISVESCDSRVFEDADYRAAGAHITGHESWHKAPNDAIILGLKELPETGTPLAHRHIMFGHAYKQQAAGRVLLDRFKAGGGMLYDLESLTDDAGRRVAAFGYWAGYAGAAIALKAWAAQAMDDAVEELYPYTDADAMSDDVAADLSVTMKPRPTALVIGALGRVGRGATDLCESVGVSVTKWDMKETAHGGPFPEVLQHDVFLNAILAMPGCPVFVPASAATAPRKLSVIGDIACDPGTEYSPIKVYDQVTDWEMPAIRVHDAPPLDVVAIDNLPSLLPLEASKDFADQLLPHLMALDRIDQGVWARAKDMFDAHV